MDDPRIAQLEQWMRSDHSIKVLVRDMLRVYDEDTLTLLLQNRPDDFTQAYESIEAMVQDIGVVEMKRDPW